MVLKSDFFVPLVILIPSPGYEPFRKREKESVDCPF